MPETALRHSPLHERHLAAGAKLSEFAGWELPLNYEAGTLAEHKACREDAVAFDVSHLGTLLVRGGAAEAVLQWCFTNDLGRISPGRAQYTHLLDPDEAWVIDDIIVWWQEPDLFRVLPNAANTEDVAAVLRGAVADMPESLPGGLGGSDGGAAGDASGDADIEVNDITASRALIAVQGPRARERLASISPDAAEVARFGVDSFSFEGETCYAAGTGYTGEDGVECEVPASVAPHFWGRRSSSRRASGRARSQRHFALGGRLSAARTRARPRHHARECSTQLGGRLGQAFLQRQRSSGGAAHRWGRPPHLRASGG